MAEEVESKKMKVTSSSDSSTNRNFISKLSIDLAPQIFSKLPVKSLCRFKCVSKDICSMIQDPVFVEEHRSKAPFCWEIFDDDKEITIQYVNQDGTCAERVTHTFRGSGVLSDLKHCNGLIAFHNNDNELLLYNLTDENMIHIPTVPQLSGGEEHFEFGFDSLSKKYKILVWMEDKDADYCPSDVHIRTLEKDSPWRPIEGTPQISRLGHKPQVNVNGTLFWFDASEARIISFDLADETFRITQLPGEINLAADFEHSVFGFEGCLGLVELPTIDDDEESRESLRCHFEIINFWVLKDIVSHQWISMLKNTIIPLDDTNLRNFYMYDEAQVADFSARNGEILIAAADGDHQYIFLYSFLNGQFKLIKITGLGFRHILVKNHVKNYIDIEEFGDLRFLV